MAHLTYFDTIEEYNAYINSEDYVSPNVSYCADADAVFMKEDFTPSMSAVFNIEETGMTMIADNTEYIKGIRVDGQLVGQISSGYKFTTTGNHTVEYQFRKQNTIPNKVFYGSSMTAITSFDLTGINNIGDDNFYGCTSAQFGDLTIRGNIGNSCFLGAYGLTSLTVGGNVGDGCFGGSSALTVVNVSGNVGDNIFGGLNSLTRITVGGNIGNYCLTGNPNLKAVTINGNIGNNNFGGSNNLTDVYIGGNVGSYNFGGISSITSMTINGSSVGDSNFFSGLTTLHIYGDLGSNNTLYNIKHLIVDGDMGNYNMPGSGLEDVIIGGNLGTNNFGGVSTLTAVTVDGNIGNKNFGGCGNIETVKIAGCIGGENFQNNTHKFYSVEIGGSITGASNEFKCNTGFTSNITISGDVLGGNDYFYSGDTLTIKGNVGYSNISYWNNVIIEKNLTSGGISFSGVKNVRIKGNLTYGGIGWGTVAGREQGSFIIEGSILDGGCFCGITTKMIQVYGNIGGGNFQNTRITDVTSYTVSGSVGDAAFSNFSGLTDVTVNGDVGKDCFAITYASYTNSITSLTLTENCKSYGGIQTDLGNTTSLTSITIQRETPPALSNSIPPGITIYVPASAVDTYKAASGWSTYASQIQAIPNE